MSPVCDSGTFGFRFFGPGSRPIGMRTWLSTCFVAGYLALQGLCADDSGDAKAIRFVVGPSNHPPGTHEVGASARLLKFCLDQTPQIAPGETVLHNDWIQQKAELENTRALVFLGDQFPVVHWQNPDKILAEIARLADAGRGFVAIHYAIGLNRPHADVKEYGDILNRIFGGYSHFIPLEEGGSVARVMQATIEPVDNGHPVLRGVRSFDLLDEPYYRNKFPTPASNTQWKPLATAKLPPEAPSEEVVAWCLESVQGSRGVAIVLPHFYENWQNDNLRKLVLNAIYWAARLDVPENGVSSELPDLQRFDPDAVRPKRQ